MPGTSGAAGAGTSSSPGSAAANSLPVYFGNPAEAWNGIHGGLYRLETGYISDENDTYLYFATRVASGAVIFHRVLVVDTFVAPPGIGYHSTHDIEVIENFNPRGRIADRSNDEPDNEVISSDSEVLDVVTDTEEPTDPPDF